MACILAVGIATLDIINKVSEYPPEDSEVRALKQRRARGGNATNTLTVLSQLGHRCSWAGVLVASADGQFILDDLARNRIDTRYCHRLSQGAMPTSYIQVSAASGSRSIVHYRDLPEFDFGHFTRIDLQSFDWLHFEGRNVDETAKMLAFAKAQAPQVPRSVEIEKPRERIDSLFPDADLLLFSRAFAQAAGAGSAPAFLSACALEGSDMVITWGDQGAWVKTAQGDIQHAPAVSPERLVDTLGAGDTFNAALIDARLRGYDWRQSLLQGCELAGRKCGQEGLERLNINGNAND